MIRAVTIDFWNTLFDTSNGEVRKKYRDEALVEALAAAGAAWNETEVRSAYKKAFEMFEMHWFGSQRTSSASESLHVMWNELSIRVPAEIHTRVARAFEDSILIGMPCPLPGALEAVATLAKRYRTALISDTAFSPGSALRRVLEKHGFDGLIHAHVFSDETGVAKPHPKAFQTALELLGGISPEEAVHIGDIERTDIAGAKACGMKAVLFLGDAGRHAYNDTTVESHADARATGWEEIPSIIERMKYGD